MGAGRPDAAGPKRVTVRSARPEQGTVRPSFPTTSPVAAATARILAAYLSNHKLSPAEAASLSGRIVDALVSLASGCGRVMSETPPARAEQPAAKRRAKPREAGTAATEGAGPAGAGGVDPRARGRAGRSAHGRTGRRWQRGSPKTGRVPAAQPIQAAPPEAVGPADLPRKRKRAVPAAIQTRPGRGCGA